MYVNACPRCGQLVFFHNSVCLGCGAELGYDPSEGRIVTVDDPSRRCLNRDVAACNWTTQRPGTRCRSCELTRTRPDDGDHVGMAAFAEAEAHKRRAVAQLLQLGLPVTPYDETSRTGLAFDLLSSVDVPITTGHAGGVITLDLAEVDDVHRERVRVDLDEPYRTVLGHFRHELGHQQFPLLVAGDDLGRARELFGDERLDYQAELYRHYHDGPPPGWEDRFVSAYATMHPAEDWAETFAHYLHIRGTMDTAAAYRLRVDGPQVDGVRDDRFAADPAGTDTDDVEALIATWLPLSYALNAVNRQIGGSDLYPFVLPPTVIDKLGFVHRMVRRAGSPPG